MGLILLAAILQNLGSIVGEDLSHRLMNRLGALGELLGLWCTAGGCHAGTHCRPGVECGLSQ